jgi:pimeloyl-ACP methyl ester carboxylesterase
LKESRRVSPSSYSLLQVLILRPARIEWRMSKSPLQQAVKDLASLLRLAASGTIATSRMVEDLHRQIDAPWRSRLISSSSPQFLHTGITGLVHRSIRIVAASVGAVASLTERRFLNEQDQSARRIRFLSILNGVMGDQLKQNQHAWALEMQLCNQSPAHADLTPNSRATVIFVHGLCMSDFDWQAGPHPRALRELGYHCLFLRYNTGLSIADNGEQLSLLLEQHVSTDTNDLVVVGHSMGGLLMRSAVDHATKFRHQWIKQLTHCIYLGTPHGGAPLERIGRSVAKYWQRLPLAGALAPVAGLRSRGIQDLSEGVHLPFARGCRHLIVAGTLAKTSTKGAQMIGDGLVPLDSALAVDPQGYNAPSQNRLTLPGVGHLALLKESLVTQALVRFLTTL